VERVLSLALGLAAASAAAEPRTPEQVYAAACAACHGTDGRGTPQSTLALPLPPPDFTDCSFATREPDADWLAVTHQGGPARGFDRRMPAFGQALSEDELEKSLEHVRTFCSDAAWPRGELNLPRPLFSEKAFPEDEAVFTAQLATEGPASFLYELAYEKRFGARNQLEVAVPFGVVRQEDGRWGEGVGDVAVGLKRAFFHRAGAGTIVSGTAELILPSGDEQDGLGRVTFVFEPFVSVGQLVPYGGFLHLQAGLELPFDTGQAGREAFWRATLGRSFTQGRFGRTWSPMVELLGARELEAGAPVHWDLVPLVQVTLSTRQHVRLCVGTRLPLNDRDGRSPQVLTYLLWDWFDGGLFDGW
jgi:hypothetical protein